MALHLLIIGYTCAQARKHISHKERLPDCRTASLALYLDVWLVNLLEEFCKADATLEELLLDDGGILRNIVVREVGARC